MSAVQSDASDVLRVNKLNTEAGIRDLPFACFQAQGGAHCMFSILNTFSILRHKCVRVACLCVWSFHGSVPLCLSSLWLCNFFFFNQLLKV